MKKYFRPKEDITAYEVAFILAHSTVSPIRSLWDDGIMIDEAHWNSLTANMQRHFTDEVK